MKVLFVCTGNTCRSPMAGAVFNKLSESAVASSAGIAAMDGDMASHNACLAMEEIGIDINNHRARRLTDEILTDADVIYTMNERQKNILMPYAENKVKVISSSGISDPFGGDLNDYRKCRDEIINSVKKILSDVNGEQQC